MKSMSGAPLMFRIAKRMARSRIRGASFLMRRLEDLGMLNVIAQYQLGRVQFCVPLSRFQWDLRDIESYEVKLINTFCRAVAPLNMVTLFDCGADIGTFSSLVCHRTEQIAKIFAFEPNLDVHEFLQRNLSNLPVPSQMIPKAVSNFNGRGLLERADYDPSDHARFLLPGDGPIEVTTIDSMNVRDGDIAIKLDVEGGELNTLKGAVETILSARQCVVTVEAHPAVARRTGQDPIECLLFLKSLRPFHFVVAETGEHPLMTAPLLRTQQTEVWNIVGSTYSERGLPSFK